MTAIEEKLRDFQAVFDDFDTVFPYFLEATIPTPLPKMIIHGIVADLLLARILRVGIDRKLLPLATGVKKVEDVVEHLIQRDLAHIAPLGFAQVWVHMLLELLLCQFRGASAQPCDGWPGPLY